MTTTISNTEGMTGDASGDRPSHQAGIWIEWSSSVSEATIEFERPFPIELVQRYVSDAARHAVAERVDGEFFVTAVGFEGVWAQHRFQIDALKEFEEVLFEWVVLKLVDSDRDLPVVGDIDLNGY